MLRKKTISAIIVFSAGKQEPGYNIKTGNNILGFAVCERLINKIGDILFIPSF